MMTPTLFIARCQRYAAHSSQAFTKKVDRHLSALTDKNQQTSPMTDKRRFLCVIGLGVAFSATAAQAAPITTNALALNSTTDYVNAPHLPYANPNAPKGGTLSLQARGTFNSANKWMTTGIPMAGTDYMYDTLMTSSLDEAFTIYPQLADKVTYDPEDTSWIIYHIHPKARFWDGSTVTAEDVKATFDALLTKGPIFLQSYLGAIKEVQVLDTQRVKFVFNGDDNKEILLTVGAFPVFAKRSIEADFDKVMLTPLLGSGPYRLDKVNVGRSISYVRDPNYWGRDLMVNRGRYNFAKIKFVYYQSDEIAFEGFKSGQYRFRVENKAANWATGYTFPAMQAGMIKKEDVSDHNPVPMQGIIMNQRKPLFQDIRVRQALTKAYDFEWMNKTLFHNQYERLQSYFYGSELEAKGKPTAAEMAVLKPLLPKLDPIQRKATLEEWQLPKSDGTGFNRAQLLEARKLLLEAGFYYQDMKLYQPDGKRARIQLLIAGDTLTRVALFYVRNLQRLGFDAQVQAVDTPQYIERMRRFDYDMAFDNFLQSLSPGAEQIGTWGSSSADETGSQNTMGIKNPAIDAVIDKLTRAKTREEIVLYTHILDRLLRAGYYLVPLYGTPVTRVAYWDEYRHPERLPSNALGIDYWWVDKDAEQRVDNYLKR